ncbi:MAG: NifB/NifX family molybdenum-iron cluster-binding protein [Patescibacteria group bacterium]|nr:NifB/NifX family molybdenum-iron cluster-binding protein [Patescibacteria group bacterium]
MKIAIAVNNKDQNSQISERAGRASHYLIFDEKGKALGDISNPFLEERGGAGTATAEMLADKGISVVIAGDFGRKMTDALENRGVRYYKEEGSVEEVLKKVTIFKK